MKKDYFSCLGNNNLLKWLVKSELYSVLKDFVMH